MIKGSNLLISIILCLMAGLVSTGSAIAQTRTVSTTGTATEPGSVKITIEDFNKPGWLRQLSTASPADSDSVITVNVQAGWTCQQTSEDIRAELVQHLPPTFGITIFPEQPCSVFITCNNESCHGWAIQLIANVPGQTFTVADAGVPVERTSWGGLKALRWRAPSIRQH